MKVGKFFKKLFPCLSKQEEQETPAPVYKDQDALIDHIVENLVEDKRQFLQDELCKERQRKLEELRLEELKQQQEKELEQQRLESEKQAREEFEKILKEAEEKQKQQEEEEEERLQQEELRKQEEERLQQEELRKQEEERLDKERLQMIIQTVFVKYKEQYHEFFSTRPQPIHSNFNEKMFKELCSKFTFNSEEELETCLKDYNLMQKQNKTSYNQLSRKRKLKCDVFNFYLFIDCNHF
jgi:flagellar biosynthesis GTPase FlhF